MTGQIFTDGNFQGVGNDGLVASLGSLTVVVSSTGLNATTWQDSAMTITNTSPIALSSSGKAKVFLNAGTYNITLKDINGIVIWTLNDYVVDDYYTKLETIAQIESVASQTIGTIAALRLTPYAGQQIVSVTGYYTAADNIGVREYYWDATSTETDNGGTIIQVTGVVTGRWKMKYSGAVNVKWFGAKGDGVTDDSNEFALAFGNTTFNNITVFIPYGTFIIKAPITIPCGGSLVGEGAGSVITADFGAWVGADYRAIIVKSKEGINYNGLDYNAQIRDFSLFGINNSTLVSIGIDFRAMATINLSVAVNYSWYNGIMTDVLVSGFDTGINIFEMWDSTLRNINVMYCRASLVILGKAVNITFDKVAFTNHTNANTSSASPTIGISTNQSTRYTSGASGRPEGIVVTPGSLIFGASTNLYILACMYFRISESIIDGASSDCIKINVADNVSILNNYIFTSGTSASGILLESVATSDSKINITGNYFFGNSLNTFGVYSNGVRKGVTIKDNFFRACLAPIWVNNLYESNIEGNYGRANLGNFIYSQSGGDNVVIDANTSDDNFSIINLHPTASANMDIRNNKSAVSKTYFSGKVTMLAGATTISLPSSFHTGITNYIYSITIASPNKNIGAFWVTNNNSTTPNATLTTLAAIAADTVIYYTAKATPLLGL